MFKVKTLLFLYFASKHIIRIPGSSLPIYIQIQVKAKKSIHSHRCRRRHRCLERHRFQVRWTCTGVEVYAFTTPGCPTVVMLLNKNGVFLSKTIRPRAPCDARCMGHAIRTWSTVCSAAPHLQFSEGARPHLCVNERRIANTSPKAVELNPSCLEQAHSNRPGTGSGYKNTNLGSILKILRVQFMVRPLRSTDAKSNKVVQRFRAAGTNGRLNLSFSWRASKDLLKRIYNL